MGTLSFGYNKYVIPLDELYARSCLKKRVFFPFGVFIYIPITIIWVGMDTHVFYMLVWARQALLCQKLRRYFHTSWWHAVGHTWLGDKAKDVGAYIKFGGGVRIILYMV